MFDRLRQMLIKEFIQAFRDPRMRGMVFMAPVIQLLVFGYAASTDVKDIATAVYDLDHSPASRDLIARFANSGYFHIVANIDREEQAAALLDHGDVRLVLRLNPGFANAVRAGRPAPLQLLVDGTDATTASVVLSYATNIALHDASDITVDAQRRHGPVPRAGTVELQSRAWFNENLESRDFFVPGVVVLIITLITLMLSSMAIVREKEIGTIEQIMVSPIRKSEYILGKTLPFLVIGAIDVALVMTVGVFWFAVPLRGSLLLLLAGMLLFVVTTLGCGLLISTVCSTQQQAMMTTFFFFQPAMLLSGFVFPIANMPTVVQWLTYLNPMRYLIVIVRGIFLKGVGFEVLWQQYAALALLGALTMLIATRAFSKTLG